MCLARCSERPAADQFRHWAGRCGWNAVVAPAAPSPGGGSSGGVFAAVRNRVGAQPWPAPDGLIAPARAVGIWAGACLRGGIILISVYLHVNVGLGFTGERLSNPNWVILMRITRTVCTAAAPWSIGGE